MDKEKVRPPHGHFTNKVTVELVSIFALCVIIFALSGSYDVLESLIAWLHRHEAWEIDEIICVALFLVFALAFVSVRRWRELRSVNGLLLKRNAELESAMDEIRQLKQIIPICASCKSVRDDAGFWHKVEAYFQHRSGVEFSHGICPDCINRLYPEYAQDMPLMKKRPARKSFRPPGDKAKGGRE